MDKCLNDLVEQYDEITPKWRGKTPFTGGAQMRGGNHGNTTWQHGNSSATTDQTASEDYSSAACQSSSHSFKTTGHDGSPGYAADHTFNVFFGVFFAIFLSSLQLLGRSTQCDCDQQFAPFKTTRYDKCTVFQISIKTTW